MKMTFRNGVWIFPGAQQAVYSVGLDEPARDAQSFMDQLFVASGRDLVVYRQTGATPPVAEVSYPQAGSALAVHPLSHENHRYALVLVARTPIEASPYFSLVTLDLEAGAEQ